MGDLPQMYAGDLDSRQAWTLLDSEADAVLVDVRTRAEWTFVGIPDLSSLNRAPVCIEWQSFPSMQIDPDFVDTLKTEIGTDNSSRPLLFLCRSGSRSRTAAMAMTAEGYTRCFNIADGFEGPTDQHRHRGGVAGWKAEQLPWHQG